MNQCVLAYKPTLREESSQTNVILQYKLLASILSAVCSVIQQAQYVLHVCYTLYDGKYDYKITTHQTRIQCFVLLNNHQYNCNITKSFLSVCQTNCTLSYCSFTNIVMVMAIYRVPNLGYHYSKVLYISQLLVSYMIQNYIDSQSYDNISLPLCHTMACFELNLHTLISGGDHVVLALYRSYL